MYSYVNTFLQTPEPRSIMIPKNSKNRIIENKNAKEGKVKMQGFSDWGQAQAWFFIFKMTLKGKAGAALKYQKRFWFWENIDSGYYRPSGFSGLRLASSFASMQYLPHQWYILNRVFFHIISNNILEGRFLMKYFVINFGKRSLTW